MRPSKTTTSRALPFSLLVLLSVLGAKASAQDFKDFKWRDAAATTVLADSLLDEDAVAIFRTLTVRNEFTFGFNTAEFFTRRTVHLKIQLLTQNGVDEYSNIRVFMPKGMKAKTLDARTIKPDGTVVHLEASEIKMLSYESALSTRGYKEYRVAVPGTAVGDEIEMVYVLEAPRLDYGGEEVLHAYLPTLKSVFAYSCSKELETEVKTYNGTPKPKVTSSTNDQNYSWTMSGLGGLARQRYASPKLELPTISYAVRRIDIGTASAMMSAANWHEVYEIVDREYPRHTATGEFYKWLKVELDAVQQTSSTNKFLQMHTKINEDFEIVEEIEGRELEEQIADRRIDEKMLERLYRRLLDEFDLSYYMAFGRDKYSGTFDFDFVNVGAITDVFFCFYDENETLRYVYPSTNEVTYQFDELPSYLEGTEAILIRKTKFGAAKGEEKRIQLPTSSVKDNQHILTGQVSISTADLVPHMKVRESYSGALSLEVRKIMNALGDDEELREEFEEILKQEMQHAKVVSFTAPELDKHFPFKLQYTHEFTNEDKAIATSDSLVMLSMTGWFLHELDDLLGGLSDEKRALTFYTPYVYSESFSYFLVFDKPVEITNVEQLNHSFENSTGSFKFQIDKMNEQTYKINFKVTVSKFIVPAEEYNKLLLLYEEVKSYSQASLVVKIGE